MNSNFVMTPVSTEFRNRLQNKSEQYIKAVWDSSQAINHTHSEVVGQLILDYCESKKYCKGLTFLKWNDGNIIALSKYSTKHLVIGSFCGMRFILRGIVKKRHGCKRFTYSFNGQSGIGSIQVSFIGEEDFVVFDDLVEIEQNFRNNI